MQEVFEKIIEKLEELKNRNPFIQGKTDKCRDAAVSRQTLDYAIEIVKQAATEYNNGWIPVSERLPNKEEYLRDDGRFIVTDGNRRYQAHFDIYEKHEFGAIQLNDFYVDECVIAWQPLPEPYQNKS